MSYRTPDDATDAEDDDSIRYDVAIVGGGPAGCAAGVLAARYGLETVVFDRGNSSLARCAFLENYLGFPGGIDVQTFIELIQAHAEEAGCTLVRELVSAVDWRSGRRGAGQRSGRNQPTVRSKTRRNQMNRGRLGSP